MAWKIENPIQEKLLGTVVELVIPYLKEAIASYQGFGHRHTLFQHQEDGSDPSSKPVATSFEETLRHVVFDARTAKSPVNNKFDRHARKRACPIKRAFQLEIHLPTIIFAGDMAIMLVFRGCKLDSNLPSNLLQESVLSTNSLRFKERTPCKMACFRVKTVRSFANIPTVSQTHFAASWVPPPGRKKLMKLG